MSILLVRPLRCKSQLTYVSTIAKGSRSLTLSIIRSHALHPSQSHRLPHSQISQAQLNLPLPTRQAVVHVSGVGQEITIENVVRQLEHLRPTPEYLGIWKERSRETRHALVILLTPKLAPFLERNSSIIPEILKAINGEGPHLQGLEVDVVYGVVDSMPPTIRQVPQTIGSPIRDGMTVMYGESQAIMPDLEIEKQVDPDSLSKPGSITFFGDQGRNTTVTAPLANTLFTNGNLSTLKLSTWKLLEAGGSYAQDGQFTAISSVSLGVLRPGRNNRVISDVYVPGVPLTPARPIIEGYGNIVRTLEFEQGDVQGASLELETKVPKFLEEVASDPTIDIWALLIPKDLYEELSGIAPTPSQFRDNTNQLEIRSEIGGWLAKGARLCRVQSGGGGWGAKAGLLSLEPETIYEKSSKIYDFDFEEISIKGLGDIAKSGQFIQFFTARKTHLAQEQFSERPHAGGIERRVTIVGTVPSSIDALPQTVEDLQAHKERSIVTVAEAKYLDSKILELMQAPFPEPGTHKAQGRRKEASENAEEEAQSNDSKSNTRTAEPDNSVLSKVEDIPRIYLQPGYFGFASEGGMYLDIAKLDATGKASSRVQTKVSIPHSYLWRIFGLEPYERQQVLTRENAIKKTAKSQAQSTKKTAPSLKIRRIRTGDGTREPKKDGIVSKAESKPLTAQMVKETMTASEQKRTTRHEAQLKHYPDHGDKIPMKHVDAAEDSSNYTDWMKKIRENLKPKK